MKLTTKMIKDIIREEMEKAEKEKPMSLDQVAKKLGVPNKDIKKEGIENITPENIMLVMQALAKMGVELSPAILGGGMVAAAMKIKDAMQDQEVIDTRDDLYDED